MSSEFGGHHFFGPEDEIFYVEQEFYLKVADMNLEISFFFNFFDFHFSLTIFRTRFWPRGHVPRGCSANEKERSWKANMFRHKNFENRIKIEGVMALTFKIFQITECMICGP